MKRLNAMLVGSLVITLAGCATSSQVQEMIDASQRDFLKKSKENAGSIDVLKKTAKASLEKDGEHAATILELERQLAEAETALATLQSTVEAAQVMTASSVVKTSELKGSVDANKATMDSYIEKMKAIDELYEKVLIAHFQTVIDSANAAITSLEADNKPDDADAPSVRNPVLLDEPIEIVAPDTSASTNVAPVE